MNEGLGLTAADVAAVTRNDNDDMWGGNCWIWIIFITEISSIETSSWKLWVVLW